MRRNLKVILFTRKNLNKLSEIKYIKKKINNLTIIYDNFSSNKDHVFKNNYDYIISYRSKKILKKKFLKKAKIAALNFHPGPPEFRGIGCANFAIMNKSKFYGLTLHLMDEKIDHGKILFCNRFKINYKTNLNFLLKKTYKLMGKYFIKLINDISLNNFEKKYLNKKKKYKWSKKIYTRKQMEKLYSIKMPINKIKLQRVLMATIYENFRPHIKIDNSKYYIEYEKI